ncbi:MAG UNVERIFIED_CONTAM: hypothetical protein LVT10_06835 [Anaerolineae bacterium]
MSQQDQGADATQGRWLVIPRTLCFSFFHGDRVLLMKRAPIGESSRITTTDWAGILN